MAHHQVAARAFLKLLVVGLALPSLAIAAPPANDNYLGSTTIVEADGSLPGDYTDNVDTTEASTQPDTFNPTRDGAPASGGKPEPTGCPGGAAMGKTVWWDFVPPVPGGVEIVASGIDAVVAIYEWNANTSQLGALVTCQNDSSGATETVLESALSARTPYTIQVGGANGIGGPLSLKFTYFPDSDGDGVLDEQPDRCRTLPGITAFGGCPPLTRGTASLSFDRVGGGLQLTKLSVDHLARGARVEARCGRCGKVVRKTAKRQGTLSVVDGFRGRTIRAGDQLVVRIMQPKSASGRYRHGSYGKVLTWTVSSDSFGRVKQTCTLPGSRKVVKCP